VFEALKMDVYRVSQKEREEAVDLFATQFWESKDATKDRVLLRKTRKTGQKGTFCL
jgi:hypothetical protein